MRKFGILLFTVLCFAAIFINRASWLLSPSVDVNVNENIVCLSGSISDSSILAEITQHLDYDIPDSGRIISGERSISGNQRRTPLTERSVRPYGKQLLDFCCFKSILKGFNCNKHVLRLASDGFCLNVSLPNEFFIFSLHKIRV